MQTKYQYIEFIEMKPKPKTRQWQCINVHSRNAFGIVYWYSPWRRYVYEPTCPKVVYSGECLKAIDDFLFQADADQARKRNEQANA